MDNGQPQQNMQKLNDDIRSNSRNNNYAIDRKSEDHIITLMNERIGYNDNGTWGNSIHYMDEHPSCKENQEIKDITIRKGEWNTNKKINMYENTNKIWRRNKSVI